MYQSADYSVAIAIVAPEQATMPSVHACVVRDAVLATQESTSVSSRLDVIALSSNTLMLYVLYQQSIYHRSAHEDDIVLGDAAHENSYRGTGGFTVNYYEVLSNYSHRKTGRSYRYRSSIGTEKRSELQREGQRKKANCTDEQEFRCGRIIPYEYMHTYTRAKEPTTNLSLS
ncbi:hypothetical protein BJ508DRAFT_312600 [Ascobolus immersus RN42]|uniref:Uncharacterized protein n=1 Tax=Ascobolus immersus RN42 TaxID=1160509 RepID=A0A3N4HLP6_ASCIM|nr:hypothetical protein BJ508DRAFT_312600 [Ascobolus immersus RN42]